MRAVLPAFGVLACVLPGLGFAATAPPPNIITLAFNRIRFVMYHGFCHQNNLVFNRIGFVVPWILSPPKKDLAFNRIDTVVCACLCLILFFCSFVVHGVVF
jgi:hypothetical protein